MTIKEELKSVLDKLGVPVGFHRYTGDASTWITFSTYNEQADGHSEDELEVQGHYIQVDIWSKTETDELEEQVKSALQDAEFYFNNGQDLYEADTKIYHKGLRFYKASFLED
jgi:hypothetical protein